MSQVMWYYQRQQDRAGPVTETEIAELIGQGVINSSTLVWREGMGDWQEVRHTDLYRYLPAKPGTGQSMLSNRSFIGNIREYLGSEHDMPRKLKLWFAIFMISLSSSLVLIVLGVVSWVPEIVANMFSLLILYHLWKVIPEEKRYTSPLVTVLLLIVPLFNLVWNFFCYYAGAGKVNQELELRNIKDFKVNTIMVLGHCILEIVLLLVGMLVYLVMLDPEHFNFATPEQLSMVLMSVYFLDVLCRIYIMRYFVIGIVKMREN